MSSLMEHQMDEPLIKEKLENYSDVLDHHQGTKRMYERSREQQRNYEKTDKRDKYFQWVVAKEGGSKSS